MSASRRRRWRRRARPFPFEQQDRKEAKAAAVKHRDFAIYGLDETWAGRRWVGGWGSTGDRITNITLAHGNVWNEDAPLVRVETAPVGDDDEFARADTAQGLAATLFHDTDEYLPQTGDTFRPIDPTASWEQTSIDLDGTNTPFRLLLSGPWWVALGEVPGCLISIEARHFDPKDVHLVTIDSAEWYLADDGGPSQHQRAPRRFRSPMTASSALAQRPDFPRMVREDADFGMPAAFTSPIDPQLASGLGLGSLRGPVNAHASSKSARSPRLDPTGDGDGGQDHDC